jgi:hypothetical protein
MHDAIFTGTFFKTFLADVLFAFYDSVGTV